MIMWLRRRRSIEPPPSASVRDVDEITVDLAVRAAAARQALAQEQLRQARAREPQVRAHVRRARAQLARNGLGELFDQALGMGPEGGGSKA